MTLVRTFMLALALGSAAPAMAEDAPPDLKGAWTGTFTGGVRQGGGLLYANDPNARFVKPGEATFNLTIERQEGRGFMGVWAGPSGSQPVQGVIRMDNKTLLMVDPDSLLEATLISPNELEFCNHTVSERDHFSFCYLLKRP